MTLPLALLFASAAALALAIIWYAWRRTGLAIERFAKEIAGFGCILGLAAVTPAILYLLSW